MSSICDDLRAAILQTAMRGELTNSSEESWYESEIGGMCELCTGNSISESVKKSKYMKVAEGRNYIGTKDLAFDHSFNYNNGVKIPFDEKNFRIANRGDILLCVEGGSAGRKIGILGEDVNYGNKLCRFSPNDKLNNKFLYFYIQSPLFQEQFSDSMTGIIGGVSIKKIKAIVIRFPDVAEQRRIVEKVDELMARVTDLEKSADALASLKRSFPDDIKASLLQAAMQGKLTEQLPEDGTAEELLEQIKVEKEKLIAKGKIKKQKPLASITDDEIPFEIPDNWKWVRFGDVNELISGTDLTPDKYTAKPDGIVYITGASNIQDGQIIQNRWTKNASRISKKGDLLLTCKGTVGATAILDIEEAHIARQIMAIRPICINIHYAKYFVEYMVPTLKAAAKSMIPGIERGNVLNMLLPLPPLAEQKRIVEKVDHCINIINVIDGQIRDGNR